MFYPAKKDPAKKDPAKKDSTKDLTRIEELLQYLKQQTLMVPPPISEMQCIQNNMDNLLYRTNLGEDQKAKQYMQLQNKFLNYKHQLKSLIPEATIPTQPQEPNQISMNVPTGDVPTAPNPVQKPPEIIPATPVQVSTQVTAPQALSTMATSSSISFPSLHFDSPSHSRNAVTS